MIETDAHRGFTLVEMLVVISIFSLLIALLLPALGGAREAAMASVCASNVRQLATANLNFATDTGRLVPYSVFDPQARTLGGGRGVNVRWCWSDDTPGSPEDAFRNGLLSGYLGGSTEIAGCPARRTPEDIRRFYAEYNMSYPVDVHYGYNGLLLGEKHRNFDVADSRVDGYRRWVGYRPDEVREPTRAVMFADAGRWLIDRVIPNEVLSPSEDVYFRSGKIRAFAGPSFHGRHPGASASTAWVDGHVTGQAVRFGAGQSRGEIDAALGFMAPEEGPPLSNAWMVVK